MPQCVALRCRALQRRSSPLAHTKRDVWCGFDLLWLFLWLSSGLGRVRRAPMSLNQHHPRPTRVPQHRMLLLKHQGATTSQSIRPQTTTEPADTTAETDDNVLARAAAAGASATLNLDNSETYAFNILCALESQESAGQEILFTAVSYDNPVSLVVTQFGAESFGGAATISLYDSETYDNAWSADTLIGGELALEMTGNTVTGSGVFLAGEERTGPGVPGSFEANC